MTQVRDFRTWFFGTLSLNYKKLSTYLQNVVFGFSFLFFNDAHDDRLLEKDSTAEAQVWSHHKRKYGLYYGALRILARMRKYGAINWGETYEIVQGYAGADSSLMPVFLGSNTTKICKDGCSQHDLLVPALNFCTHVCTYVHVSVYANDGCMYIYKLEIKMHKYKMSHVYVCVSICVYFGCIMLYALSGILVCSVTGLLPLA